MSKLVWDQVGTRLYETGVDRGVFYPTTGAGVPWNGLTSVDEEDTGGDAAEYYMDGVKYLDTVASEDFQAVIGAYSAPPGFVQFDGGSSLAPGLFAMEQPRQRFGFCYRTRIGDDVSGYEFGYKLHLVYNAIASPTKRPNKSINDAPTPLELSWTINASPPAATGYKRTAHFVVVSALVDPAKLLALETLLYGDADIDPVLPPQSQVITTLT